MDPFAAAAWISHVFVTIHPFEVRSSTPFLRIVTQQPSSAPLGCHNRGRRLSQDGNGRLSRILASIPLMKKNLPPICIAADSKLTYYENLNQVSK